MPKGFQGGHVINLGRHHSQESRKKMSEAHMGKQHALKHGNSPYKKYHIMQKSRIALLKRTKGRCELCDNRGKHIHHLDNSRTNHNLENLMFVCQQCHSFLHAKFDKDGRHVKIKVNTKHIRKYGMTLEEIGKKFKVSRQSIHQWIQIPEKEVWLRKELGIK